MVLTRSNRDASSRPSYGSPAPSSTSSASHSTTSHSLMQLDQSTVAVASSSSSEGESALFAPPLPAYAEAPGSPLFGAGEEHRQRQRQDNEDDGGMGLGESGVGGAGLGMEGVVEGLSGGGFGSNAMEKGEDYSALFNDILSTNGLSHLVTDNPIHAFPYTPSQQTSGFGLPTSTVTTSAPPTFDPRARHYALDTELVSPLLAYEGDAASPLSYAGSPYFPSSNEASPAWGAVDEWSSTSPAVFDSKTYDSAGVSPALGQLDLFGEYGVGESDYSMHQQQQQQHFDAGTFTAAGPSNVDGATSTGASYVSAAMLPPLPAHKHDSALLFSPVIPDPSHLGALTPVLSDNDDADVSPTMLPPPLPSLATAAATVVKIEDSTADDLSFDRASLAVEVESSPEPARAFKPTKKAAKDDSTSSDGDYVPTASTAGPKRSSTRRSSTCTTSRKASSPAPLAGIKVALDAPVTKRSYAVESRTSAKPIPKSLQKKMDAARRRGEEVNEEEYVEEATRKRKANTLSARESRAKKALRVAELERLEGEYREEREKWEGERDGLRRRIGELEREVEELREEREREGKRVRRG